MSSTIRINGNFFHVYNTSTGDEIIRENRKNVTFSNDGSDVFSFYFDTAQVNPNEKIFKLGNTQTDFAFADLRDYTTGLVWPSVSDLEDFLSLMIGSIDLISSVDYEILDSAANVLYSGSQVPGGSISETITDSTAVLKNTLGTTLLTENILAQDSEDIEAPDGTAENSDASYSLAVESGNTQTIPDSDVEVNGNNEGSVVSVKTIEINVSDGAAPVTPTSIVITGNTVDIEVPAASSAAIGLPLQQTGQTTSYATGDNISRGRATDFFTLPGNNPFGNTNRFTDELGGSTYTNNIVIDWSKWDQDNNTVPGYYRTQLSSQNWATQIANALAVSIGSFTTGWELWNIVEAVSLCQFSGSINFSYSPLNIASFGGYCHTATSKDSTFCMKVLYTGGSVYFETDAKANNAKGIATRLFTVTGTTLS